MVRRAGLALTKWLTRIAMAMGALALVASALLSGPARADDAVACAPACPGLPAGMSVDPASYKLWPSGARTLLDTTWDPGGSVGVFALLNSGSSASPAFTLSLRVENHDPISERVLSSTSLNYDVPALDAGQSLKLGVPLDYTQCNIYLFVAPDSATATVLRTGDPAAC